ncbi:hypothetical protein GPK34_00420 [Secundilactobacillus kimchicus]|uniref:hypothetical protein n=1 Tax=Secundilactobacillus kimchicus TaxID=528209 RepID=UPI001C03967E|nr:hypothetical protein [Secundilactobacillus kimchicus]MBT9670501.1 hypothetical protein [Secundilactobacillus kimchicus]
MTKFMDNQEAKSLTGAIKTSLGHSTAGSSRGVTYELKDFTDKEHPRYSISFTFMRGYLLTEVSLANGVLTVLLSAIRPRDFVDLDLTMEGLSDLILQNTTVFEYGDLAKYDYDTTERVTNLVKYQEENAYGLSDADYDELLALADTDDQSEYRQGLRHYLKQQSIKITKGEFEKLANAGRIYSLPVTLFYKGLTLLQATLRERGLLEGLLSPIEIKARQKAEERAEANRAVSEAIPDDPLGGTDNE